MDHLCQEYDHMWPIIQRGEPKLQEIKAQCFQFDWNLKLNETIISRVTIL